jgi:hypothetical protein
MMLAEPSTAYVRIDNEDSWFFYYDLSTWDGTFLQFLHHRKIHFDSRGGSAPFLVFENTDKVKEFIKYLEENANLIAELKPKCVPDVRKGEYHSIINLEFLCKVKMIYDNMPYS